MNLRKSILLGLVTLATCLACEAALKESMTATNRPVYVLPIRSDIMPPLVYLVRRGVKAAIEDNAQVLVLDMETNGGRVDTTEEIIRILGQFHGETITYVNGKAFSAGAFIAVATQRIYMAPQSVIGAAAPLLMMPGAAPTEMPQTMEAKMTSGIRALVRANAEKNGHNVEVIEAMIDKNKVLELDGEVLNEKGQILTLTNKQAEKEYGNPPRPLLSLGTFENLDQLLDNLGVGMARRVTIQPTGVEQLGTWINALSPILLIIGVIGLYIEFKTPGFGLPGIVGIVAFALYFLGSYVAGLSGIEWIALFIVGLILLALELFIFPGTTVFGFIGAALVMIAIVLAMVDIYPNAPGLPAPIRFYIPIEAMLLNLAIACAGSVASIGILSLWLPKTAVFGALVSHTVSGEQSVSRQSARQERQVGDIGIADSDLRPGGKARFGEEVLDVITQGDLVAKGARVRIIGHSAAEAIVAPIPDSEA